MNKNIFLCVLVGMSSFLHGELIINGSKFVQLGTDIFDSGTAIRIIGSDVQLDLNGHVVSSGYDGIVVDSGVSNVQIYNGRINGIGNDGIIILDSCSGISVTDVTIKDAAASGIAIEGTSGNWVQRCRFNNIGFVQTCTGATATGCFSIAFGNDIQLNNSRLIENGDAAHDVDVIHIEDSQRCKFQNVTISNNQANVLRGVVCASNTQSCAFRSCFVVDNIAANGFSGFFFESATSGNHILNNCEVTNNELGVSSTDPLYGFAFELTQTVQIQKCVASGNINLGSSATSHCYGFCFDRAYGCNVFDCQSFLNRAHADGGTNDVAGFYIGTTGASGTGVKNSLFLRNIAFSNDAFNDARSYGFNVESAAGGNENNTYVQNYAIRNGPNTPTAATQIVANSGTGSSPGGVPSGSIRDKTVSSLNSSSSTQVDIANVRLV